MPAFFSRIGIKRAFHDNRRETVPVHIMIPVFLVCAVLFILYFGSDSSGLRAALFSVGSSGGQASNGIYISTAYEAQPNERGSVTVSAGQSINGFTAMDIVLAVDPSSAELIQVKKTALTQHCDISITMNSKGYVHVALVGNPRAIAQYADLLELELKLADRSVLRTGMRVPVRILSVEVVGSDAQPITHHYDGSIRIITNQDALDIGYVPMVTDVHSCIHKIVASELLIIRGRALPKNPRVLLGMSSLKIVSASDTEIVARVPEDFPQGVHSVSVGSINAAERVVVFTKSSSVGSVDIIDELLFADPNPIVYTTTNTDGSYVLWVPVYNPLGQDDPIIGSVDLSSLGGDPSIQFDGVGESAIGPGGVIINWHRIPESGEMQLGENLITNTDYNIPVRVENRSGTQDSASLVYSLRSVDPRGDAPSVSGLEFVPSSPIPGENVSLFVDITDGDGISSIAVVTLRLTSLGGALKTLNTAFSVPNEPQLTSAPYTTSFSIDDDVIPGEYPVELRIVDDSGNETVEEYFLIVYPPGGAGRGQAPEFVGRLDAYPVIAGPSSEVNFFAGVRDLDGTQTIDLVTIDLVDIGGTVIEMSPTVSLSNVGTLPVIFESSFTIPDGVTDGEYELEVRVVDANGQSAISHIPLTIDETVGSTEQGKPPVFQGRKEIQPTPVEIGGTAKFFIGVKDPDGAETIERVIVETIDIGGDMVELEASVDPVDGSAEPLVFTGEYPVPSSIAPGVYSLAVQAFDEEGNAAQTTLLFTISATGQSRGKPAILQAFPVPLRVPADDKAKVVFRIEAEDEDGIEDIVAAWVDLSPLDLDIEELELQDKLIGDESVRGYFESKSLKIPSSVRSGTYSLNVQVEDSRGNRTTTMLNLLVGTVIGGDAPTIKESRFVPEVIRPGSDVRLYVEIEDSNGATDSSITAVADFTEIDLELEELSDLVDYPSGTVVTRNTFATKKVSIPEDTDVGVYDVPLTVVDDTGNIVRTIVRLRVERGGADDGQAPMIATEKTFQVPRVFANTGDGGGELHILVHDPDDDVATVMVKLGSLGTAKSGSPRGETEDLELLCDSSSAVLCMEAGTLEETGARWFILSGIEIPPTTQASKEPYIVEVTAIDEEGHMIDASVPVRIGGEETEDALKEEPAFELVVPVNTTKIELVLNSPINTKTIDPSGSQFVITQTLNAAVQHRVRRVSWDTTGRYLYMETDALLAGEAYVISAKAPSEAGKSALENVYGNRFSSDRGGSLGFTVPANLSEAPAIQDISVPDFEHVRIRFTRPVLPSSVHPDVLAFRSSITSTVMGDARSVYTGILSDAGRVLTLNVEKLREGDRYRLRISDVLAQGLISAQGGALEKTFMAIVSAHGSADEVTVFPTADLNHDGVVDFADFSLFSSVYSTEYNRDDLGDVSHNAAEEEIESSKTQKKESSGFGGETPDYSPF